MSQAKNIDAINTFVNRSRKNPKAQNPFSQKIIHDWDKWYSELSFWAKTMDAKSLLYATHLKSSLSSSMNGTQFGLDLTDQAANMTAINEYITTAVIKTPAAQSLLVDWKKWYNGVTNWDATFDQATYNTARSKRDAFNLANAATPEEKQDVQYVIDTGMTTEQLQGKPKLKNPFASQPTTDPTIRRGSSGNAVIKWQKILGITADGIFGSGTEKATKTFQSNHGITPDGIVGPATWAAAANAPIDLGDVDSPDFLGSSPAVSLPPVTVNPSPSVTSPPVVQQASIFSAFTNLPTWAKALLGVGTVAGVALAKPVNLLKKK